MHATVKTVDYLGGRHSVAGVNELTARDKIDVIKAFVASLDRGAVGDFKQPLANFASRKVAVYIGADIQQRVFEAYTLKFLCQTGRLDVGNVGIAEKFLNDFQIYGFTVAAAAYEYEDLLVSAVGKQNVSGDKL